MIFVLNPNLRRNFAITFLVIIASLVYIKRLIGTKTAFFIGFIIFSLLGAVVTLYASIKTMNGVLMRNDKVVEQPYDLTKNLAERLVREGVRYLEGQVGSEKPFLLYMSWVQVHNALHASKRFQGKLL